MALFKRRPKITDVQPQDDVTAVERYEYLLATAQPDVINRIHVEAFGKLPAEARQSLFERLSAEAPSADAKPIDAEPATLARVATDAETARPGSLLRSLGLQGAGSSANDTLLATISSLVVASPLATALFRYRYGDEAGFWAEDMDDGLYF
jgi:hypothetical protein